jgi:hypothetical protein
MEVVRSNVHVKKCTSPRHHLLLHEDDDDVYVSVVLPERTSMSW